MFQASFNGAKCITLMSALFEVPTTVSGHWRRRSVRLNSELPAFSVRDGRFWKIR